MYGDYLKNIRLSYGYTLKQVSQSTNISIQNLSRWERNEVLPNISFCIILADFYDVSLDYLFGRTDY